jgi:hypothetical protein
MSQIRSFCKDLKPIKDKCIGILTGNHEETILKKYHLDPAREIAYALEADYGGYCSLTKIIIGKKRRMGRASYEINLFAHHGYGGGRKHGAQLNKIEDALRVAPNADIFAMGHVHGKAVSFLETIDITYNGKMLQRQKIFLITSSFVNTYKKGVLSYAEKGLYTQAGLGAPVVRFRKMSNVEVREIGDIQSGTKIEMKVMA